MSRCVIRTRRQRSREAAAFTEDRQALPYADTAYAFEASAVKAMRIAADV